MKTILLVDDEANIRFVYEEEFKEEGYRIISAANGEEALNLFENDTPDLVILDIQMPGMNGIEVNQDLGAWASEDYIVKSSDLQQLKDAVHRYLDDQ